MSITFRDLILYNIRNLQNYMVEHDLDDIEASFETLDVGIGDPEKADQAFIVNYKRPGGDSYDQNVERYSRYLASFPEDKIIFTSSSVASEAFTINHQGKASSIIAPEFNFLSMSFVKFLDELTKLIDRYNNSNVKFNFGENLKSTSYYQTNRIIFKKNGILNCEVSMDATYMNDVGTTAVKNEVAFNAMDLPSVKYPSHGHLQKVKVGDLYIDYHGDVNGKLLRELVFGGVIRPENIIHVSSESRRGRVTNLDLSNYQNIFVTESIIDQVKRHFEDTHFEILSVDFDSNLAYVGKSSFEDVDWHPMSFESLKKSGQVDIRDANGNTALMLSIIQHLYSHYLDEEILNKADYINQDEQLVNFHLFRELHSIGASLSIRNNQGDDALSLSVKHQNTDIMELIFELDRDAGFTTFSDLNYQGVSIMDLAIATEDQKIIELMDDYVLSRNIHQVNSENAVRSPRKFRM